METAKEKVVEFPAGGATPQDVREAVRATIEVEGLSQNAAARQAGVKASTLSQFLSETYAGDNNKVAGALLNWLNSRASAGEVLGLMPAAPVWIEAPTARRIYNALAYAQAAGDVTCVYGGAGLSKTTTIRRYRALNPNVWVVTATPATASCGVMLEETAIAMGLKDFPLHPARLQRAILGQIAGSRGILIYDESQHLTKQALEAARSLHDATGVGLALAGNASVYNRLYGGGDNGFAQLFSRVGRRVALKRPLAGDVAAIAGAFGVKGREELRASEEIAARPGALRMLVKVLRLAAMGAGERPIGVDHIRAAWDELQGGGAAEGGGDVE